MAQELGAAAVMVTPTKEAAPTPPAALKALYAAVQDGCPGLGRRCNQPLGRAGLARRLSKAT